jgi:hypothetical protein
MLRASRPVEPTVLAVWLCNRLAATSASELGETLPLAFATCAFAVFILSSPFALESSLLVITS